MCESETRKSAAGYPPKSVVMIRQSASTYTTGRVFAMGPGCGHRHHFVVVVVVVVIAVIVVGNRIPPPETLTTREREKAAREGRWVGRQGGETSAAYGDSLSECVCGGNVDRENACKHKNSNSVRKVRKWDYSPWRNRGTYQR